MTNLKILPILIGQPNVILETAIIFLTQKMYIYVISSELDPDFLVEFQMRVARSKGFLLCIALKLKLHLRIISH